MTVVMDGSWETLLKNTYNRYVEVSQQRLGDGRVWRYDYSHDSKNQIVETTVTFQDGHKRQLRFRDGSLAGP
jgi:excinuclease UvrABC nuclease subunit